MIILDAKFPIYYISVKPHPYRRHSKKVRLFSIIDDYSHI